ncbi:MAG TPA: aminoglycoside adenylyltransferase family protein [Candidatus Limnocylindrales bacterium]|nr:aminoglycoside adenylyltransferase family protein [Candidatus Limnocylindrales bacterium]
MAQTDEIVRIVRDVLGDAVIGAYVHGSAVLGGLRPTSDVDVLVVLRRRTTVAERRHLVDRVMDISGRRARRGPGRPVELTIVVQSDVRPWRYPPRSEFQYGEWLRDEYERGLVPSREPSPDLAPLITMALAGDTALFGPPPAELLDSVPVEDLRRAIVEGVPGLLEDLDSDTRNVILTLARIWSTLATGEIRSKDAAADWALAHLPDEDQPMLARARAFYLEGDEGAWADVRPDVRSLADRLVSEIERLAVRSR